MFSQKRPLSGFLPWFAECCILGALQIVSTHAMVDWTVIASEPSTQTIETGKENTLIDIGLVQFVPNLLFQIRRDDDSVKQLLGHPIHPMLIVFPLGLLATAVAFDIVALSSLARTTISRNE
jgi:hypothetical protein